MQAGVDESGDVGNVHQQVGSHALGELLKPREINDARVGAGTHDDHARAALLGDPLNGVVVNRLCLTIDAVEVGAEQRAGEIDATAVRQVAAVGQIHPEDDVARLEDGQVGRHIGLRS